MKKILKSPEPHALTQYRLQNPQADWEMVRSHSVYQSIVQTSWSEQGQLCAFCERKPESRDRGIEHFLQKSASPSQHNWALDWKNMLAVCKGGELHAQVASLPQNLSCDKHKNHWVNKRKLPANCEGYMMNPLQIQALNHFFAFDPETGKLDVNASGCATHPQLSPNHLNPPTNQKLIENTLAALNLNCPRLCRERKLLWQEIQKSRQQYRQQGEKAKYANKKLVEKYFSKKWHFYFTSLRLIFGQTADSYLQSINYQG